ncbi:MAG: 16S rRNA (cytosine(1402)-N(4))-methyltransferase RsmH [Polyangiaceae bacterium]|nr:16S rRNA (cytosine(1402)-N(4))-methyltransferase RsmH [Polyangiaceae bacterium]
MPALRLDESIMFEHKPIMVEPVIQALAPQPRGIYIDATAGGGGHSAAILEACAEANVIAFDRDLEAVEAASARLAKYGHRAEVVHLSFDGIKEWLRQRNISKVDGILADLGVSSHQIDSAERGMSFRMEGPLDMRMDASRGPTALELIEGWSQDELADVIYQFGEERRSRRVARCIKQALELDELHTTLDLRRAIVRAVGPQRTGGLDPATRTFQALRIAVNGELDQLKVILDLAREILVLGGTAAIMSFHSLEDRLVKRAFTNKTVWERLSTKPIVANAQEQQENPRSRSAKLRAARRCWTEDLSPEPPYAAPVVSLGRRLG